MRPNKILPMRVAPLVLPSSGAKTNLKLLIGAHLHEPLTDRAFAIVERELGMNREALLSRNRTEEFTWPRFVFMRLAIHQGVSMKRVGKCLNRDHGTVHYGLERIAERRSIDREFDAALTALEKEVVGG